MNIAIIFFIVFPYVAEFVKNIINAWRIEIRRIEVLDNQFRKNDKKN